ncbi:MAG: DASS family sodium-coupled anion symporter [Candidatus Thorarchaeota archaeon]|nr:DASS family sodium-coupled anion symporter [Candidatus Thorarchaeota archaeon]
MSSKTDYRRLFIIILFAVLVGILVFNIAPSEVTPGDYKGTLNIEAPGVSSSKVLNFTLSPSKTGDEVLVTITGSTTNVTVRYTDTVRIAPGNTLSVVVSATGEPIEAEHITLILAGPNDFEVLLRPTRQKGQTFTIEYQPLVRSNSAAMILAVVAILWFTEGISLVATSILIPIIIVITAIASPKDALMPFFDPAVALIFGGFMIGRALDKYELDRRLALLILSRVASSGSGLVLAVMGVTAFLSMWISNTAAAAIMIPIALAVISKIESDDTRNKYAKALVLGVAYSATLGGVGTIVGSPPNPLAATYVREFLGVEISFLAWLPFGLPVLLIMVPLIWRWLVFRFKLPNNPEEMAELERVSEVEYAKLGPMTAQEKVVVIVFLSVVTLWLTEQLPDFLIALTGWRGHGINSAIVSLMGGLALLVLRLLDEKDISHNISWSSLLILGSGIALGEAMISTGLSTHIAQQLGGLGVLPGYLVIMIIGVVAVLVTMVASNTGAAVILIPIAIPLATTLGIDPLLVTMIIAIGVSMDFALPTGTPPSTIAYSTGEVELQEMVRTGLVVDLTAIMVLTTIAVAIWSLLGIVTT